jgi:RHS repeat-associated protein
VALTDSTGALQTQYTYEPFGNTSIAGAASANPLQYTGRENDGTGLYYYRARYYSPKLQRFISEDPIEFGGGDVNLYAYVFNSPTNYTDPTGEIVPLLLLCARGAATSIAIDGLAGRKVDLTDAAVGCLTGGLGGLGKAGPVISAAGKAGKDRNAAQDKSLTSGEIKKLEQAGYDVHELKGGKHTGHTDLFKDRDGNIYQKPKSGGGDGDPIGINIKDLENLR